MLTQARAAQFGRLGSRSLAYHAMVKYRISSEKLHDRATLHTSQSCRPCCIAGLQPGIVSTFSSAFHALRFFVLIRIACFAAVFCVFHVFISRCHVNIWNPTHHAAFFETKTLSTSRASFDGTGVSIHHLSFSPLDHCIHHGPPSQPILCHARPISTNTLRQCLLPSPHPEPTSMALWSELFLQIPQPFHIFCVNIRLVSRCGPLLSAAPHGRTTRSSLQNTFSSPCKILCFSRQLCSSFDHRIMCASGVSVGFLRACIIRLILSWIARRWVHCD